MLAVQNGGYFARRPRRCLAFCKGQPDQSCLVPTVCPLQAPLLDVVKTALEAAMVRHRTQLLRGSGCSTIYLQSQIYVTQ
jgi:hypothetical protein